MKLTSAIIARVAWLSRVAATTMGFALILALVLGVGTTALAAVPGDPFRLGQTNVVNNAITALVGTRAGGAMMLMDNNSNAAGSRALDLRVESGRAPLTVNADAGTAPNLSADKLDGKDATSFYSGKTYIESRDLKGLGGGIIRGVTAFCDEGDKILGGGGFASDVNNDELPFSAPTTAGTSERWSVIGIDNGEASNFGSRAICADFPPLR